jgi:hypothetical protein
MKISIPLKLVTLQEDGFHILVEAQLNGENLLMVVDTGASRSCFDIHFLENLINKDLLQSNESMTSGIGTNSLNSVITIVDELCIGELTVKNYEAVGIDMSHIHHAYTMAGVAKVDGILGGDILLKHNAVINYRKRVLLMNSRATRKIVIENLFNFV